ncbi:hypothetical protein AVEN_231452-1 [Araneus ventricosus]|uniref:Uncharacterized protein n=1 Tax=Araneus ventricosus TaxID=182803 RepID=A0A4Y2WZM3_ARAVE|nr:hypothetical protein AVEN_231452-1 [Araneus ventricosus]
MKNLLIVIGFWVTVGSNFFSHAGEGETAPSWGSIRGSLGENTPAGLISVSMPATQEGLQRVEEVALAAKSNNKTPCLSPNTFAGILRLIADGQSECDSMSTFSRPS